MHAYQPGKHKNSSLCSRDISDQRSCYFIGQEHFGLKLNEKNENKILEKKPKNKLVLCILGPSSPKLSRQEFSEESKKPLLREL